MGLQITESSLGRNDLLLEEKIQLNSIVRQRSVDSMREPGSQLAFPVSICVLNYNGGSEFRQTLGELVRLTDPNIAEFVVIDDGSTDGGAEWAEETHPEVRVVRLDHNEGLISVVRNAALRESKSRYVMMMDNDIRIDLQCISELMKVMVSYDDVLCCTPRVVDIHNTSKIYGDGGKLHFLCLAAGSSRGRTVSSSEIRPPPRPTIGTGIMLIDKELSARIGDFDEGFVIGSSDGEYHFRGRIAGYNVLQVPAATIGHLARPHGKSRAFGQLYNRYRMLLIVYSGRTLILLSPALILFEILLTIGSIPGGFFGLRNRAVARLFRERRDIRRRRLEVQALRTRPDSAVLCADSLSVLGRGEKVAVLRFGAAMLNGMSRVYWRLVRRWL